MIFFVENGFKLLELEPNLIFNRLVNLSIDFDNSF